MDIRFAKPRKMSSSKKKITLMSMDGVVDEVVALELKTIKDIIGDNCVLTLSCIAGKILAMVIDYCKKHVETPTNGDGYTVDELKAWDADFLKVDQSTLFNLILAADYLNIKGLLDLASKAFVDMVRGKTPEIIRTPLNCQYDFTPEEEEAFLRENQSLFK